MTAGTEAQPQRNLVVSNIIDGSGIAVAREGKGLQSLRRFLSASETILRFA
jgi:hypothetical protein